MSSFLCFFATNIPIIGAKISDWTTTLNSKGEMIGSFTQGADSITARCFYEMFSYRSEVESFKRP